MPKSRNGRRTGGGGTSRPQRPTNERFLPRSTDNKQRTGAGEREEGENEQRSHVKCAVCGRATHRDRSRHSSARIMLYFTLWMRGRCFLTTNLCSLQISLSFPPSFSLFNAPSHPPRLSLRLKGSPRLSGIPFGQTTSNQLCRPLMYSLRRP